MLAERGFGVLRSVRRDRGAVLNCQQQGVRACMHVVVWHWITDLQLLCCGDDFCGELVLVFMAARVVKLLMPRQNLSGGCGRNQ